MSFLLTENSQFKENFILYDLSLCSSEISPLNLGVPSSKKKSNISNRATISSSRKSTHSTSRATQDEKISTAEIPEKTNRRQQSIRRSIKKSLKSPIHKDQVIEGEEKEDKVFQDDIPTKNGNTNSTQPKTNEPKHKILQKNEDVTESKKLENKEEQSDTIIPHSEETSIEQKKPKSLRASRMLSIRGSQAAISTTRQNILADMKRMLNGYYFIPLIESQAATMVVSIEFTGRACEFSLHPPTSIQDKIVVTAKCENTKSVDIFYEQEKIIDMKYNSAMDSFNAVVLGLNIDICMTQFRDKETTIILPGFDKVQSRQKIAFVSFEPMVPLAVAAEKSGKEPFIFNLTYNYPNPLSFDISQNSNSPTCTFKCELINNSLKCTYPFSPIQAFIALLGSFLNPHRGLLGQYQNMFE